MHTFMKPVLVEALHYLKPHGFKRKSSTLIRTSDDVVQFVNAQSSDRTTAQQLVFTINISVFSRVLARLQRDPEEPRNWLEGHMRWRIADFTPDKRDLWWVIGSEHEARSIGTEVGMLLGRYAVPHLDSCSDTMGFLNVLRERPPGILPEWRRREYTNVLEKYVVAGRTPGASS
jgi:hypothetical protein